MRAHGRLRHPTGDCRAAPDRRQRTRRDHAVAVVGNGSQCRRGVAPHSRHQAPRQRIKKELMSTAELLSKQEYKYGFVTEIESDVIPRGLTEDTIRLIVEKKNEPDWMLEFRLKAFRNWLTMTEPRHWPNLTFSKIDYQNIIYYSAPKQ